MTDRMKMVCPVCSCWYGSCKGRRRGCPVATSAPSDLKRAIWTVGVIAICLAYYLFTVWSNGTP